MDRPIPSRRRNSSHVAQCGTSSELAISTRGASGWVLAIPTARPDCTSSVSSDSSSRSALTMRSKSAHDRAALPLPPYTISSSGFSATSGSRLFISMRIAASVCHDLQVRCVPRGARTGRGEDVADISFVTLAMLPGSRGRSRLPHSLSNRRPSFHMLNRSDRSLQVSQPSFDGLEDFLGS